MATENPGMTTTSALCPANSPIAAIIASVSLNLPDRGWQLHPLHAGGNQPLLSDWPARASAEIGTALTWTAQYPGCNWGLAAGRDAEQGRLAPLMPKKMATYRKSESATPRLPNAARSNTRLLKIGSKTPELAEKPAQEAP
jgi:hypothetical protein